MRKIGRIAAAVEVWSAWRDPIEVSVLLFGGWLAAGLFAGWAGAIV
ncbi:hypothetical protein [Methylobacterium hispanicum]|jgi:hypothetical protein|uniref:Uncharacterized protein n=1 Tax=Methylobacterium hispanicum TaxID=270350 RepID=A0AAV4ZU83_9HYPH|nr:hypothetical protein [Methylobacterium hispanicum]GJD91712.1 hypothetical protein BHAOGJBA_5264 [Methylobacterium hispanicum]